ncbi:MAG: GNAT family N-acetyltransferase [Sedimentisphaerales bacterium]|nr:GNAT family N-acetyltransferase [Sedimentisphaerales bacterium]
MEELIDITIRQITQSDDRDMLRQLAEISMKGNEYDLADEVHWKNTLSHFEQEFAEFDGENNVFFIAEQAKKIIGFARGSRRKDKPEQWWLNGLEVLEDYRGRGIGTQLGQAIIDELSKPKISCLWAHIAKNNIASLKVAQKLGLRIITDVGETIMGEI